MKLLKRFLKGNNKGLSLVELVCAVAIFGLSTTVIGGAMVVSSQSYQRGTIELDVQKEAQATTNLIGNLLVDAVDVQYDASAQKMTVTDKTGATFEVFLNAATGELKYKQGSEEVVLAEGVSYFKVDRDDFATSKNVEIDLQLTKGDREYKASYNTTARNGQMTPGAAAEAKIFIDNEVVLEPGQSYTFNTLVSSSVEYGNLVWTMGDGAKASFTSTSDAGATVRLDSDAADNIAFTVATTETKIDDAGNTVPLASETVVIKVRRVTGFASGSVNHTVISGTDYTAGAVYRVYAQVSGTNLEKQIGKAYDSDYVNPKYVDFKITGAEGGITTDIANVTSGYDKENSNLPYIEFTLTGDMPVGSKLVITATAKHPAGWSTEEDGTIETKTVGDTTTKLLYNKTSTEPAPFSYDNIFCEHEIINDSFEGGSGLKRGDNDYKVAMTTTMTEKASELVNQPAPFDSGKRANQYLTYMRVWKTSEAAPTDDTTGWTLVNTTGTLEFKIEKKWSLQMDPRYDYYVELLVAIGYTSNPTSSDEIAWPVAGTDRNEYISRFKVNKATYQMKSDALGVTSYGTSMGTKTAPIGMAKSGVYCIDLRTTGMNYTNLEANYEYIVEKLDASGSWVTVSAEKNDFAGDNDEHRFIEFSVRNSNGTDGVTTGDVLRIRTVLTYPMYSYNGTEWVTEDKTIPLYDESNPDNPGTGMMYFIVTG